MIKQNSEEKIYTYGKKKYVLADEVVKGGCQGCAFYNRLDCAHLGKTNICNKEHKIFMRKLENE